MFRTTRSHAVVANGSETWVDDAFQVREYDAEGRVRRESPWLAMGTPESDWYVTSRTMQYDTQGRLTSVALPAVPGSPSGLPDVPPVYTYE